jgi:[ribosomal protein S5]-alanine N-acetyltransferase
MPALNSTLVAGSRVYLRRPQLRDANVFLAAVAASRRLHGRWVQAPMTAARFSAYIRRFSGPKSRKVRTATHVGLLACRTDDDSLVGVFNFSDIVHGGFQCAYLGYYALAPNARQGYMSEGLGLAFEVAFRTLRLHRVEVNIQPANTRSAALVRRAGLTREGFSRRYMKLAGRWRDHERWALLVEDWKAQRRRTRRR